MPATSRSRWLESAACQTTAKSTSCNFAPLDVDHLCLCRILKLPLLLVELVTSLAEGLPVVLAVLIQAPRAIKLSIQPLDRCSSALARCSRPAGAAKAIPERGVHFATRHQLRELVMDRVLEKFALEHARIAPWT